MAINKAYSISRLIRCTVISGASMFTFILINFLMTTVINVNVTEPPLWAYIFQFFIFSATVYIVSLLFSRLKLSSSARRISLFCYFLFMTGAIHITLHAPFISNAEIGYFFTVSVLLALVTAGLMQKLFIFPEEGNTGYLKQVDSYFKRRDFPSWVIRLIVGGFLLFITFYLINSMFSPFLEPYYRSHNILPHSTDFASVKKTAMFIESGLMLLVFLPLFALWNGSKSSLLFWFGFPLFLVVALQPFFFHFQWPLGFRFPMFIQSTLIMYIQAIILVHLFYVPADSVEDDNDYEPAWSFNDF